MTNEFLKLFVMGLNNLAWDTCEQSKRQRVFELTGYARGAYAYGAMTFKQLTLLNGLVDKYSKFNGKLRFDMLIREVLKVFPEFEYVPKDCFVNFERRVVKENATTEPVRDSRTTEPVGNSDGLNSADVRVLYLLGKSIENFLFSVDAVSQYFERSGKQVTEGICGIFAELFRVRGHIEKLNCDLFDESMNVIKGNVKNDQNRMDRRES